MAVGFAGDMIVQNLFDSGDEKGSVTESVKNEENSIDKISRIKPWNKKIIIMY